MRKFPRNLKQCYVDEKTEPQYRPPASRFTFTLHAVNPLNPNKGKVFPFKVDHFSIGKIKCLFVYVCVNDYFSKISFFVSIVNLYLNYLTLAKTRTYIKRIDRKVLRVSGWPVALSWPPPMVHQIWDFPILEKIIFFIFRSPKNQVFFILRDPKIFWATQAYFLPLKTWF